MWRVFVGCCLFLLPLGAQAAVTFSEIAWMGTATSVNHEWIELHNDGAAADVTGWTLTDGANLNVVLSGTIPAGAYAVLERTSDESAPGTAFLIYTGALVNTGATLRLLRADGSVEDMVNGGEDWQSIGGDNETKDTAQYTTSGWVTAAATPGRAITQSEAAAAAADPTPTPAPAPTIKTSSGSAKKTSTSDPVVLTLPDVTLQLKVAAQSIGYVHQPIKLAVQPSGIGDTLIDSLQYEWNFGDGETATTKEVTHVYRYPGTYVVTVYGGFKRQEQVARHEITILPVTISLTTNAAGDIQVNNDSPYDLDLSGYRVVGEKEFVFPPRTIILPNQTITLSKQRVGTAREQMLAVYDTEATLVASFLPQRFAAAAAEAINLSPVPYISAISTSEPLARLLQEDGSYSFAEPAVEEAEPSVVTPLPGVEVAAASEQLASVGAAPPATGSRWPYLALAATILLATIGLLATPQRNENP